MKYLLIGLAAGVAGMLAVDAFAQQSCVCTNGCKVVSDAYAPGPNQPTSCNIYKSGTQIATGTMVDTTTVASSNSTVCLPPDSAYIVGQVGSKACLANIPAQVAGSTVALTVRGVNGAGEAPDGTVLTFLSVSQLPAVPPQSKLTVRP